MRDLIIVSVIRQCRTALKDWWPSLPKRPTRRSTDQTALPWSSGPRVHLGIQAGLGVLVAILISAGCSVLPLRGTDDDPNPPANPYVALVKKNANTLGFPVVAPPGVEFVIPLAKGDGGFEMVFQSAGGSYAICVIEKCGASPAAREVVVDGKRFVVYFKQGGKPSDPAVPSMELASFWENVKLTTKAPAWLDASVWPG